MTLSIRSRKHRVTRKAGVQGPGIRIEQYLLRVLNPLKVFGLGRARLCLLNVAQHQLCQYPELPWSINVFSVTPEFSLGRGMALRVAVMALLALLNLNLVTGDHFRWQWSTPGSLMMMVLLQETRAGHLPFKLDQVGSDD